MEQTEHDKIAAYYRLSSEDDKYSESTSISNQRDYIKDYCDKRGLTITKEYVDDGYSGATFDRPAFMQMIADIEAGKINCVITKDLSRLGRNHYMTGFYLYDYFPKMSVRYISISDNIDTAEGENEIAPYLNIHNELTVRETSRKVKAAMAVKYKNGDYVSPNAPIGYIKDPDNHCHLLPDPETAYIVKKIFDLTLHGVGKSKICRIFEKEKIPTPAWIAYQRNGKSYANVFNDAPEEKKYQWCVHAIDTILNNEAYIGNSVHYKQVKVSFRSKKIKRNPKENWLKIENTHEPIIDRDLWDSVHHNRDTKQYTNISEAQNIFAGLIKCADCGRSMSIKRKRLKNGEIKCSFECSEYQRYGKSRCSVHYISYDNLYNFVLTALQNVLAFVSANKDRYYESVSKRSRSAQNKEIKVIESELKRAEKKLEETEKLIIKLFEEKSAGRITEKNYLMMMKNYENEQTRLEKTISECNTKISDAKVRTDKTEAWIKCISRYTEITELTPEILNEIIEKITVRKTEKGADGIRTQEITIYYRFIGKLDN